MEEFKNKIHMEEKEGYVAVSFVCQSCGKVTGSRGMSHEESESLFKTYTANDCKILKAQAWCYECAYESSWNIILQMFRRAFANNPEMQIVLDSIERVINKQHQPTPYEFERKLADRGITSTEKHKNIWNIAIDECKIKHPAAVPIRWGENKVANAIGGAFGWLGRQHL